MFAGNFPPAGWALCQGQSLSISQNSALFALLGTTYGGDGVQTFNLPDLRGRVPVHAGTYAGQTHAQGELAGTESVVLSTTQIPLHAHSLQASDSGAVASPTGNFWGGTPALKQFVPPGTGTGVTLNPAAITSTGGGQGHENRPPVLAVSFIIALQGIFPSRN